MTPSLASDTNWYLRTEEAAAVGIDGLLQRDTQNPCDTLGLLLRSENLSCTSYREYPADRAGDGNLLPSMLRGVVSETHITLWSYGLLAQSLRVRVN
jgi:hypothetical protein